MSKWSSYYEDKMTLESDSRFRMKYEFFINFLNSVAVGPTSSEWGCGTAIITKILNEKGRFKKHVVMDNDEDMLDLARENVQQLESCLMFSNDIREPFAAAEASLAHSHGVLEHYGDNEIRAIVKNMKACSRFVACYVPSHKYTYKSFGDERLMSPAQWYDICQPRHIHEFNGGKDLILTWY